MTNTQTGVRRTAEAPPSSAPPFMSQEHVDVMNELLQRAEAVKDGCAALGARRVLSYDLTGGPQGETVHWTMTLDDTVQFSLDRPRDPDVVLSGDWSRMIRATRAAHDGKPEDPGLTLHGDEAVIGQISPVLELARIAAAVPFTFPEA